MANCLHALILIPANNSSRNYSDLVVFIKEKGIAQINERYILTRTFSIAFGLAYGMNHLLYQKDWLTFAEVQLSTVEYIFNHYWKGVVKKSARFAYRLTAMFWFGYNILLSRFLLSMAMRFAAEDILYHVPQYGPRWYSIGLALRLFITSFSLAVFAESVHTLCDHFLTKRVSVTTTSVDPNACIVTGLKADGSNATPESLITYHAFQELSYLTGYDPARRAEIFSEAEAANVPSSWQQISKHCVHVLNKATSRVNQSCTKVPSTAFTVAPQTLNNTFRRRLPPGQGGAFETNIFRASRHDNFFDNFKGASTEEILAKSRIEADKALADANSGKRPNLGTRDRVELVAFRWLTKNLEDLVFKYPEIQKRLSDIPSSELFHAIEDFQLIIWCFQSLARLVVASYKEDRYGVVQRDISKILEAMLGLLMSLEHFLFTEGRLDKVASNPYCAHVNAQRLVNNHSLALVQALKTSIYQIVIAFRGQLGEFVLASACTDRLRQFVEFDD
ncbi:Nucleoporin NDC1 [Modicella reniformis]|uniref:Nucleoporin NDC1 n=1 Tax=Modicella reniformis TaxID=1440133 RepID=A0A9P6IN32_9FUNG|nr:Nucleoporin NDC1 [Modicella reniformis]